MVKKQAFLAIFIAWARLLQPMVSNGVFVEQVPDGSIRVGLRGMLSMQKDAADFSRTLRALPEDIKSLCVSSCLLEQLRAYQDFVWLLPPQLERIDLSWNSLESWRLALEASFAPLENLRAVSLCRCELATPIALPASVTEVDLARNLFKGADGAVQKFLTGAWQLKRLNLSFCSLSVPLEMPIGLEWLNLRWNNFSYTESLLGKRLQELPALAWLDISLCGLIALPLLSPAIQTLICKHNYFKFNYQQLITLFGMYEDLQCVELCSCDLEPGTEASLSNSYDFLIESGPLDHCAQGQHSIKITRQEGLPA